MKNSLKLLAVILVAVFTLTGCGGSKENKLIATKTEDFMEEKCNETLEIFFKEDKPDKATYYFEFESKKKAEAMKSLFDLSMDEDEDEENELKGVEIELDGKTLIMKYDSKAFKKMMEDEDEVEMTKEGMKKELESEGYKVK